MITQAQLLGEALKIIVDEIIELESVTTRRPPSYKHDDRTMSLAEIGDLYGAGESYLRDPLGNSLRLGLTEIGKFLGKFLTIDEMLEVAEFASSDDASSGGGRIDLIDAAWDGLPDKNGNVWWH